MSAGGGTARQPRLRGAPLTAAAGPRRSRPTGTRPLGPETRAADVLLRLLVGPAPDATACQTLDWSLLRRTARGGRVLVRASDRLSELGVRFPHRFATAVADERHRVAEVVALIGRLERALRAVGLADFLFPKAFRHYPDMSADLDLLTLAPAARVLQALTAELGGGPRQDVARRVAGMSRYEAAVAGANLDVWHGRLGFLGEHTRFPAALFAARVPVTVLGRTFQTAPVEHQLVLQGIQRVYGQRGFKLADLVFTIRALRSDDLDWDRVVRTARQAGALPGLACYLGFADRIHRRTFGAALLDPAVHTGIETEQWGPITVEAGEYRFAERPVTRALYRRFVATKLRERDWRAAGRVALLLPLAALGSAARALVRRTRRGA